MELRDRGVARYHGPAQAELKVHERAQQLTHVTRVASLTDFSGMLAHEINQPLTAILANAQATLRYCLATRPTFRRFARSWWKSPTRTSAPARAHPSRAPADE